MLHTLNNVSLKILNIKNVLEHVEININQDE